MPIEKILVDTRMIDGVNYNTYRINVMKYTGEIRVGGYDVFTTTDLNTKIASFICYPYNSAIQDAVKNAENSTKVLTK